jgi:phosphocarrier protein
MNNSKNKKSQVIDVFLIKNKLGLHARAAARFVNTASKYKSEVSVTKDGITVNGKSIMGLLTLAAAPGSKIKLTVTGNDAQNAFNELKKLIISKFNEE